MVLPMGRPPLGVFLAALVAVALLGACATSPSQSSRSSGKPTVVAAEDFWGSIARQLGGDRVDVESLIVNPDTDPHDYEPTPADARAIASAGLVITNGIGYDPWTDQLLSANESSSRIVLNVGHLLGLKGGANPHQWYSPEAVEKVIGAIVEDYKKLDPAHAAAYDRQRQDFETTALGAYHSAIAAIEATYAGTPVGASESIFAPMATALRLNLVTPEGFLNAISEGNEPTASDKATVDRQIATKAIKAFVFNGQNATPDVQRLVDAAKARNIAVIDVTETLTPQGSTFQAWQTAQLERLRSALAAATGR